MKPSKLTGNQNAAKPEAEKVSGKGRIVIDLGPLKSRVVAEANRRGPGHTLKSVIIESLENSLPPHKNST